MAYSRWDNSNWYIYWLDSNSDLPSEQTCCFMHRHKPTFYKDLLSVKQAIESPQLFPNWEKYTVEDKKVLLCSAKKFVQSVQQEYNLPQDYHVEQNV